MSARQQPWSARTARASDAAGDNGFEQLVLMLPWPREAIPFTRAQFLFARVFH